MKHFMLGRSLCDLLATIFISCCLVADSGLTLEIPWTVACQDSLGKNTGVDCYFLLQGICLIQGLNPGLLHWQVDSLPLSHGGSTIFIGASQMLRSLENQPADMNFQRYQPSLCVPED